MFILLVGFVYVRCSFAIIHQCDFNGTAFRFGFYNRAVEADTFVKTVSVYNLDTVNCGIVKS